MRSLLHFLSYVLKILKVQYPGVFAGISFGLKITVYAAGSREQAQESILLGTRKCPDRTTLTIMATKHCLSVFSMLISS